MKFPTQMDRIERKLNLLLSQLSNQDAIRQQLTGSTPSTTIPLSSPVATAEKLMPEDKARYRADAPRALEGEDNPITNAVLDYLDERIEYEPDFGTLKWIKGHAKGKKVGSFSQDYHGFPKVTVMSGTLNTGQLAYLIYHRQFKSDVLPIDGNHKNTRINNLK